MTLTLRSNLDIETVKEYNLEMIIKYFVNDLPCHPLPFFRQLFTIPFTFKNLKNFVNFFISLTTRKTILASKTPITL